MSLRIAYMTGQYPRTTDTFIQREVAALRQSGVHVETFSVRKPSEKENVGPEQQAEKERTHYLLPFRPASLIATHLKLLSHWPRQYFAGLKLALTARPPGMKALAWQIAYFLEAGLVARQMREKSLVHLHNHFSNSSCSVAMLASVLGDFTYSFTMHGPAEFFEPKYWRIDEKIRRALFVSCISQFCRSQAMIFAPQEKWDRLHIVHCGVDPSQFSGVQHRGQGTRLLFVGRLAAVKGLPVLLEAISLLKREHPEVHLRIAGDGPERDWLQQQAKTLEVQDNVSFLGYQSQAQVRELLSGTDVFVMASFAEGVPVVLMEAMAAGVPVVATQIAGVPELVDDQVSGLLVPPGDAPAIAGAVKLLLDNAELRSHMGAAGRAMVQKNFNITTEAQRLCQILTEALAEHSSPQRDDSAIRSDAETQPAAKTAVPV